MPRTDVPKRILVVEHNERARDVLSRRLIGQGFEVVTAPNGDEGLYLAEITRPDLILMDLHMPLLDGWECGRRLKASPTTRDIPMIAMTGRVRAHDRNRAMEAGFDKFVATPIDFAALVAIVQDLLQVAA